MFVKIMNERNGFMIIETGNYVEIMEVQTEYCGGVKLFYNDKDGQEHETWLSTDCYIMNDQGYTVSQFRMKPDKTKIQTVGDPVPYSIMSGSVNK